MLRKLECKKGAEASVLAFIFGTICLMWLFIIAISYQIRSIQRDYITNCLENSVRQICKNGEITIAIDENLKNKLNKMFKENTYKISYGFKTLENLNQSTFNQATTGSKFYIGDTVCIQFNLDIDSDNPTSEQLEYQPLYSKMVNIWCEVLNTEVLPDRLLQVREGMVENNAY